MKFLATHEDLEAMRAAVEKSAEKPAFLVSDSVSIVDISDCRYRAPGEDVYRRIGRLELFLSQWENSYCLGFFDADGNAVEDPPRPLDGTYHRRFDLSPSSWVRVAYPLGAGVPIPGWNNPHFLAQNLPAENCSQFVEPFAWEEVPDVLKPFVQPVRDPRRGVRTGIRFAMSTPIEAPREKRAVWHAGVDYPVYEAVVTSLQPPGWYSGTPLRSLLPMNCFGLVDRDPGACVVCHGRSGKRKHIGTNRGKDCALGCICEECFPEFAEQAKALLAAWTPPPRRGAA